MTDARRVSQLALDVRALRERQTGSRQLGLAPLLSLRPADRLALSVGPALDWSTNGWQYVGAPAREARPRYVVAHRPGSALFVVWSQQREAALAGPFTSPLREVFGPFGLRPDDRLLVKLSYWFTPRR